MKTNWLEVKERYITSDLSIPKLAKEFNLSVDTLKKRAAKEKWSEQRRDYSTKLALKIQEGVQDELVATYKEVIEIAKKELIEETKLIVEIRKQIPTDDKYAESRVNKCSATIKDILNTLEHHAYPQREDKTDNNITVVLSDDKMKEYFK